MQLYTQKVFVAVQQLRLMVILFVRMQTKYTTSSAFDICTKHCNADHLPNFTYNPLDFSDDMTTDAPVVSPDLLPYRNFRAIWLQ
jgi:hypothetical protein